MPGSPDASTSRRSPLLGPVGVAVPDLQQRAVHLEVVGDAPRAAVCGERGRDVEVAAELVPGAVAVQDLGEVDVHVRDRRVVVGGGRDPQCVVQLLPATRVAEIGQRHAEKGPRQCPQVRPVGALGNLSQYVDRLGGPVGPHQHHAAVCLHRVPDLGSIGPSGAFHGCERGVGVTGQVLLPAKPQQAPGQRRGVADAFADRDRLLSGVDRLGEPLRVLQLPPVVVVQARPLGIGQPVLVREHGLQVRQGLPVCTACAGGRGLGPGQRRHRRGGERSQLQPVEPGCRPGRRAAG